ncbi:MFS transporter [Candidatus Gracilibacteria bacterium]|nr:MFS transporter [Candidatus Gracilibacteria bacterium]
MFAQYKSKNVAVLTAANFVSGFMFFLPILALYYQGIVGSVQNVALVFATFSASIVLFEIPTGAIADLFGRRKTMIAGWALWFPALIILYYAQSLEGLLAFAILDGFSESLISGADRALLYDTLKADNQEHLHKKALGTYWASWPLGATFGAIIGGYLAQINLQTTISATLVTVVVATAIITLIKEPKYHKEENNNFFKHIKSSLLFVKSNRQVTLLFIGGMILWSVGESIHNLKPIFFEFKNIELIFFGYIMGIGMGLSSLGHYISHAVSDKFGNKRTLIFCTIMMGLGAILASYTPSLISAAFLLVGSLFFGIKNTIEEHLINIEIPSSKRATVLSLQSFVNHFSIVIVTPLFGALADLYSINTAVEISGYLAITATIAYIFIKKSGKSSS